MCVSFDYNIGDLMPRFCRRTPTCARARARVPRDALVGTFDPRMIDTCESSLFSTTRFQLRKCGRPSLVTLTLSEDIRLEAPLSLRLRLSRAYFACDAFIHDYASHASHILEEISTRGRCRASERERYCESGKGEEREERGREKPRATVS